MHKSILATLPALTLLLCLQGKALAIGITITPTWPGLDDSYDFVYSAVTTDGMGTERDSIDRKTFTEGDSYSITTMASLASPDGNMSSVGQWNLTNSANQAVFTATTGLFDGIASPSTDTHGSSRAYSQLWVFFTLTEEVRFSITGNILYSGLLNPDYSGFGNVGVGLYRDGGMTPEVRHFITEVLQVP